MFRIKSEIPLPSKCQERYSGFTYDGCYLYFTIKNECKIIRTDNCFNNKHCFNTCRIYNKICYDLIDRCFWASTDRCNTKIYKLNECFQEIGCIRIDNYDVANCVITGIAYNSCHNSLLISFACGIICIDKCTPQKSTTLKTSCNELFMGIVSVCPYIICYCVKNKKKSIRIYDCCGELINEVAVPNEMTIESAIFFPCSDDCYCHFYVLVSKHCYPYILDCIVNDNELCENISNSNYLICDKKHCATTQCSSKNACCDVLESIALVETSIAHILNAEGEKIQKAIASTDNICELLEVNDSVNKTIIRITNLEQQLYNKLETLSKYCDFTDNNNCCSFYNDDEICNGDNNFYDDNRICDNDYNPYETNERCNDCNLYETNEQCNDCNLYETNEQCNDCNLYETNEQCNDCNF